MSRTCRSSRRRVTAAAVLGSLALTPSAGAAASAAPAEPQCVVDDERLTEASGLAVAPDGRVFSHDDSGHAPRVVVLGEDCEVLAAPALDVPGKDPEDLALGPAPGGEPALWFGDVGDNRRSREQVEVDRVPVPSPPYREELPVERLLLRYPDGAYDVETLLVAPDGSALALVEKSLTSPEARVWVAEAPEPGVVTPLREVATLRIPDALLPPEVAVTAGAVRPDGGAVVLRTYATGWVWPLPDGPGFADRLARAFTTRPAELPLPPSGQGEAIAWTPDGEGVLTLPEGRPAELVETPLPPEMLERLAPAEPPSPAAAASEEPPVDEGPSRTLLVGLGAGLLLAAGVAGLLAGRARRAVRE